MAVLLNWGFRFLIILFLANICILGCGSVNSNATVTPSSTDGQSSNGSDSEGTDSIGGDSTNSFDSTSLVVQDKSFTTDSNQELQINLIALLNSVNSSKNYTFTIVTEPTIGQIDLQNAQLTYTPSQIGSDEIKYKVSDGSSESNIGKITIVVSSINRGGGENVLVLNNKIVTTMENEAVQVDLSSMISSFNSNTTYNFVLTASPSFGSIVLNGLTLTYTPEPGIIGNDQIALRTGDGNSTSNIATIDIQIQDPSSSAPRLQPNVTYTIKPNVPAILDLNLLFVAPQPFPGKTYTFSILHPGKLGSGVISGSNLTYSPILNAFGTDTSLRILVEDDLGQKTETTIKVIISNN